MKHACVFLPDLSDGEVEGLNWIGKVLENIRKIGPGHKNYIQAAAAARALLELQQFCQRVEIAGHELLDQLGDHELAVGLDFAEYKMLTQKQGDA